MHLQNNERRVIARALKQHKPLRAIAERLGRSVSSISDEVRRNSVRGVYDSMRAERTARLRRKQAKQQCLKVAMDPVLKAYVVRHIARDQSPQALSVRLKQRDTAVSYASAKAIYAFVHSIHGRPLERHLYSRRVTRRPGKKRGSVAPADATKRRITDRPLTAAARTEFGHFEGDFIESGTDGVGSILVLTERMTRYPFLVYTEDKDTLSVNALLATTLADVPVKSITLDNDLSFQKHEELSRLLGAAVFFTHAYASHEKGTVENRNKAVREYIPKRSDISQYRHLIAHTQQKLRDRFMVVLGGRSPQEAWEDEMKKHAERAWQNVKTAVVLEGVVKETGRIIHDYS
jgi:IS30 family transposase